MLRRFAPALLLAVLASCSSPADNSFLPDPPDARGTPVGPNGAFSATSSLAWSAATNEFVGQAPSGGALIAMNASTGALRPLDADAPLSVRLSADGTTVAYDAFEGGTDTLALRRLALAGGASDRVTYTLGLSPHAVAVSANGAAVAWSRQAIVEFEPGPIQVAYYPAPAAARAQPLPARAAADPIETRTLVEGTPVMFSPLGDELLHHPIGGPPQLLRWTYASGSSTPFALGLPAGARGNVLRWDAGGVKSLYAIGARELWRRDATAGTDVRLLFTPGDSIASATPVWSPDGAYAAVWTLEYLPIQLVTQARLYVASVTGPPTVAVVATGTEAPGAIAFSPDSRHVGYLFGTQVRVAAVPGAGAASGSVAALRAP